MAISRPCTVCGQPMVKQYPSAMRTMHARCRAANLVKLAAIQRHAQVKANIEHLPLNEQQRFLEGYRLGTRYTLARLHSRLKRMRQRDERSVA